MLLPVAVYTALPAAVGAFDTRADRSRAIGCEPRPRQATDGRVEEHRAIRGKPRPQQATDGPVEEHRAIRGIPRPRGASDRPVEEHRTIPGYLDHDVPPRAGSDRSRRLGGRAGAGRSGRLRAGGAKAGEPSSSPRSTRRRQGDSRSPRSGERAVGDASLERFSCADRGDRCPFRRLKPSYLAHRRAVDDGVAELGRLDIVCAQAGLSHVRMCAGMRSPTSCGT